MQYTSLGRTGLVVSRLCLGTMNFGQWTSEADAHAIMDRALDAGINFFDTANVYGGKAGKGRSEEILGSWFAKDPAHREQVVIATKVYGQMGDGPNDRGLSARHIVRSCEASLTRMGIETIDLLQMHHVPRPRQHTWRRPPWTEIWQAYETLIRQGKVLYAGSSNFAAWHLLQAGEAARARGLLGLVSEQSLYNLNARTVELEVLPACRDQGIGVIPWAPLSSGLLGGVLEKLETGRRTHPVTAARAEKQHDTLVAWEVLCRDLGEAPANVALAWLLSNAAVTAPILGPRTLEQLDGSLRALEIELEEPTMARLDELFPGPGGQAPEAYAW